MAIDWTKLTVHDDNLLVRQLIGSDRTESGILKPAAAVERPTYGVVVAVGPGPAWARVLGAVSGMAALLVAETIRTMHDNRLLLEDAAKMDAALAPKVKVGDLVFYAKFAGYLLDEAENLYILKEQEVSSSLAAHAFELVQHDRGDHWHLAGDFCDICDDERQAKAKADLDAMREQFHKDRVADRVLDEVTAGHHGQPMNVRPGTVAEK